MTPKKRRTCGLSRAFWHQSNESGVGSWRSSADRPLLCQLSLLTGNFTGNFAKSRLREHQRLQIMSPLQRFRCEFPTQKNRELFWQCTEFLDINRELVGVEIFARSNKRPSACTPKVDFGLARFATVASGCTLAITLVSSGGAAPKRLHHSTMTSKRRRSALLDRRHRRERRQLGIDVIP